MRHFFATIEKRITSKNLRMKSIFLMLSFFITTDFCLGQTYKLENNEQIVCDFEICDRQPDFPGGIQNLNKIIKSELGYRKIRHQTITFEFTLDYSGNTKSVKVKEEKKYFSNRKLKRILKSLPKWLPAMKNNKPIDSVITASIKF